MKMKIKRNSGVSVLAILGVAGGALLASIPAQAASLNGTIGLAASIKIVGTGQCAKIGSTTLAVPCTDAMADTTKPLTTFDFQDLTGAPGLPAAPFNGELSVTGATGDFLNFAPPPLPSVKSKICLLVRILLLMTGCNFSTVHLGVLFQVVDYRYSPIVPTCSN